MAVRCDLGGPKPNDYKAYLISKGVFERAIYCANLSLSVPDQTLQNFITKNAGSLATLGSHGFYWDSNPYGSSPLIYATQASALDGLDADVGGSTAMC